MAHQNAVHKSAALRLLDTIEDLLVTDVEIPPRLAEAFIGIFSPEDQLRVINRTLTMIGIPAKEN